ncbi:MAG: hypothetical protein JXX29_13455 [Deltaproteobacteria bacterium]|nr:hypothetical protein [Deltaproteobacteria bacterium]MBN2672685.1 hypothetical protein [Deltaproteobacteria bacterium]
MTENTALEFVITPVNDNYDPSDDRWLDQVTGLLNDLQAEVGDVRKEVTPQDGKKGGFEAIILALGSAGAISAAVEMFKSWISRDKRRELEISIERDGKKETYRISSNRMDKDDIRFFMEKAINRGD